MFRMNRLGCLAQDPHRTTAHCDLTVRHFRLKIETDRLDSETPRSLQVAISKMRGQRNASVLRCGKVRLRRFPLHMVGALVERRRACAFHPGLAGNVVALQLAIESGTANAQHLARQHLVTVDLLEDALDGDTLDVL